MAVEEVVTVAGRPWDADRVAESLVTRRAQLIAELPQHTRGAIGLTVDQKESVVDEAIAFVVTEYKRPIETEEDLERAFRSTAALRVRRVHEGRGETVRAGWRRVDIDETVVPDDAGTPEARLLERHDRQVLLEFAAMLDDRERDVFVCKYGVEARPQGYKVVAQRLGLPVGAVRSAERSIEHKLERFTAIFSAGALCRYRSVAVEALADASATDEQALAARVHLKDCATCRTLYKRRRRAQRRGDFQREVAGILPLPAAAAVEAHRTRGGGGLLQTLVEWVSRPFATEGATGAVQMASTGAGRGIGTMAVLKVATLCVGGLAGGAYCIVDAVPNPERVPKRAAPAPATTPEPRGGARVVVRRPITDSVAVDRKRARSSTRRERRQRRQPQPAPTRSEQTRVDTAEAEAPVVSQVPAASSGNDFDFEQSAGSSSTPSSPAPQSGGSEFLP